ncbi:MAG: hypothetical protein ABI383_09570 [Acidobacteriaceae bacterium]
MNGQIQWQRAFLATFLPAVAAILLLMVNPFFSYSFFVWIGLAGYLSVRFYRRRAAAALINAGIGARLGAVVGLFCFLLESILIAIGYVVERASGNDVRKLLSDQMHNAVAANPNPDAVKMVNQLLDRPHALVLLLVIAACILFVSFLLAATLGGTLAGAAQSRNRTPR